MSYEADLRAVLVADAALTAAVPAARIAIDQVEQGLARPYIAFSAQQGTPEFGLDNTLLADTLLIDIQCIGSTRANAIAVRELVKTALLAGGVPWSATSAGYDPDNDIEAEIVSVNWLT